MAGFLGAMPWTTAAIIAGFGWRLNRFANWFVTDYLYFGPEKLFDITQVKPFRIIAKGNRGATGASASRSSNTMDIALRFIGELEIDDMGDAVNVNAHAPQYLWRPAPEYRPSGNFLERADGRLGIYCREWHLLQSLLW